MTPSLWLLVLLSCGGLWKGCRARVTVPPNATSSSVVTEGHPNTKVSMSSLSIADDPDVHLPASPTLSQGQDVTADVGKVHLQNKRSDQTKAETLTARVNSASQLQRNVEGNSAGNGIGVSLMVNLTTYDRGGKEPIFFQGKDQNRNQSHTFQNTTLSFRTLGVQGVKIPDFSVSNNKKTNHDTGMQFTTEDGDGPLISVQSDLQPANCSTRREGQEKPSPKTSHETGLYGSGGKPELWMFASSSSLLTAAGSANSRKLFDEKGTHHASHVTQLKASFLDSVRWSKRRLSSVALSQNTQHSSVREEPGCYSDSLSRSAVSSFCEGQVWSCQGRCGQFRQIPCSCHQNCRVYQTCCQDFPVVCPLRTCNVVQDSVQVSTPKFGNFLENFPGIFVADEQLLPSRKHPDESPVSSQHVSLDITSHSDMDSINSSISTPTTPAADGAFATNSSLTEVNTGQNVSASMNKNPDFLAPSSSSQTQVPRDDFEEPKAVCVKAVQARLINSCPSNVDPADELSVLCTAQKPHQLIDVVPVTDQVTGLHFRNIHCHSCWRQDFANMAQYRTDCDEPVFKSDGPPRALTWKVQIFMSQTKRLSNETSIQAYINFIVNTPEALKWIAPERYPYHLCNSSKDAEECPSCPTRGNVALKRLAKQCQSFHSYVSVMGRVYSNKFCALCHVSSQILQQQAGAAQGQSLPQALDTELQKKACTLPQVSLVGLPHQFHDFTFSATMSFSSSDEVWVFENDNLVDANGFLTVPRGKYFNWKKLECSQSDCRIKSCAHYVWSVGGRCLEDVIPLTTTLRLCPRSSANSSSCSKHLSRFVNTPSVLFLRSLQAEVVQVLLYVSPFFRNLTQADVRSQTDFSEGYIFLNIWSPFNRPSSFEPLKIAWDLKMVRSLVRRLMIRMGALGFRGWAEICTCISKYQFTTAKLKTLPYTCATGEVPHSEQKAAMSSAGSLCADWSPCLALCVLISCFQCICIGVQGFSSKFTV